MKVVLLKSNLVFLFLGTLIFGLQSLTSRADDWAPAGGTLLSKFAKDVDPNNPLPEYPRPQMTRNDWVNLNGQWDYAILPLDTQYQGKADGKILVPFPVESSLSGVARHVGKDNHLWYERFFTVPEDWSNKHVLLNFGAVDWKCQIFINDQSIGIHQGGYTPFSFDITDALEKETREQKLTIKVWDPTTDGAQPLGKQHNNPSGIWYTPVTGIWQTVWIEPVANSYITKVLSVPDVDKKNVIITIFANNTTAGQEAKINDQTASFVDGKATLTLDESATELWTPDNPVLTEFTVNLVQSGKTLDSVSSYFAMRKTSLGKTKDGITRMMLNNEFLFQHGPLDQGWWPDGLYTAPTDAALVSDIIIIKKMGFNMLRKHVKVEPARYYYYCDKLGMLVWQDMPSGDLSAYIAAGAPEAKRTPESSAIYEQELKDMIYSLDVFPCIIMWVPFNEGWGQYDTERIVEMVRNLDPTRLVDNASGWSDRKCGDVCDMHAYPGPDMFPPEEKRATVLGEYGGLGLPIKGHSWTEGGNWGYVTFEDKESLFNRYNSLNEELHVLIGKGLSAAVYTQTTDVEIEVNGLMSYDREIVKYPVDKMKESQQKLRTPAPVEK